MDTTANAQTAETAEPANLEAENGQAEQAEQAQAVEALNFTTTEETTAPAPAEEETAEQADSGELESRLASIEEEKNKLAEQLAAQQAELETMKLSQKHGFTPEQMAILDAGTPLDERASALALALSTAQQSRPRPSALGQENPAAASANADPIRAMLRAFSF